MSRQSEPGTWLVRVCIATAILAVIGVLAASGGTPDSQERDPAPLPKDQALSSIA